jgi:hypothetical protein
MSEDFSCSRLSQFFTLTFEEKDFRFPSVPKPVMGAPKAIVVGTMARICSIFTGAAEEAPFVFWDVELPAHAVRAMAQAAMTAVRRLVNM